MWPGGGAAWSRDGRSRRRRRRCRVPRPPSPSVPGRIDRPRSPREASSASTTRPRQAGSDAPTNLIPGSSSPQSGLYWFQPSKPTLRGMKQLRTLKKPDETSKACLCLSADHSRKAAAAWPRYCLPPAFLRYRKSVWDKPSTFAKIFWLVFWTQPKLCICASYCLIFSQEERHTGK